MITNYLKKYGLTLLGIVIGAIGGLAYWRFVGCSSSSCPITSSPINSALWCAAIGGLLFNSFSKSKKKED